MNQEKARLSRRTTRRITLANRRLHSRHLVVRELRKEALAFRAREHTIVLKAQPDEQVKQRRVYLPSGLDRM